MATQLLPQVAVVGCGQWGQNLVRNFAQQRALEVLVDAVPSRAVDLARKLSDQGYDQPSVRSWNDTLKNASIDAIALATPAPQHADMAVSALAAGKNVFVEKPFALSVEDGERIIHAATKVGKLVMVGHSFQYHPAFIELRAMVHQGKLGRIKHVHSRRLGFGRIRHDEDVFWNLGPHDISMILALTDDMPVEVTARGCHHLRSHIADVATAELTFESGLQAQILVSWLYPQKERKLIVVGDMATAVFDDCEPWENKLRVFRNEVNWTSGFPETVKGTVETLALQVREPLAAECQHFLDCVQTGRKPVTGAKEALRVVKVLCWVEDLIRQNNYTNFSVAKSPSNQSFNGLLPHSTVVGRYSGYKNTPPVVEMISSGQDEKAISYTSGYANQEPITVVDHCIGDRSKTEYSIPLVDLTPQKARIQGQLNHRIAKVLNHTTFILGPEVHELEARLANYSGANHVVTCGSGTGALTLALLALEIQPGDAVLVPDLSFVATVEPIVLLGGIPIFVDVEAQYLTINPSLIDVGIAAALKAGYRAVGIIAVDLYGHPAEYNALHQAAIRHGLWVIGDAAQSFGASSDGRLVGSLAHLTITSFFPSKPLGCYGDGGAVFTNDSEMAELLRSLRQHGLDKTKSNGLRIGLNSRLDTFQAAVLLCKLDLHAEEIIQREKVAERYAQLLRGIVALPTARDGVRSAWATYTVRTKQRNIVKQHLHVNGIASAIYYAIPFHKQLAYQKFPVADGSCPVAERACEEVLSLPMGPYLNLAAQNRITDTLRDVLSQLA
jgi:dTDP-4-amino-4,6-dideoxygalactose transaminase/predicted dehydrogenase